MLTKTMVAAAILAAAPLATGLAGSEPAHAQECWKPSPTEPFHPDGMPDCPPHHDVPNGPFTAVSVSPSTLAWGSSWGFATRIEAEKAALARCMTGAADCRVAAWADHQCAALVISHKDTTWGADFGPDSISAIKKAFDRCQREGGSECRLVAHPCSDD